MPTPVGRHSDVIMTSIGYVIAGLFLCLTSSALPANEDGRATTVEVCQWTSFEPSCPPETVVLVVNASYGRRVSHLQQRPRASWDSSSQVETAVEPCIRNAFGADCLADVKTYTASRCSGRRRCTVSLPDAELNRSPHGCPNDLTSNLEVSYRCLPVKSGGDQGATATVSGVHRQGSSTSCNPSSVVTDQRGYLPSVMLEEKGIGSELCPWTVQAESGQTITLTVFDFAMPPNSTNARQMADLPLCFASVRENTSPTWHPICRYESLDRSVYISNSNVVYVKMNSATTDQIGDRVHVLVKFEATGCPDFTTPPGSVVKRTGNTATVRCVATPGDNEATSTSDGATQNHRLTCVNGNWSTSPASINCVSSTTSQDGATSGSWFEVNSFMLSRNGFLVVVVLSIALFVSLLIVVIGMVCLCRPCRKRSRSSGNSDLPYISGGSTDRCIKHGSTRSSFRQQQQLQQPDPRMHCDPTWKEMQPMLVTTATSGKYSSPPATARVTDGRLELDYGGWGIVGWPEHNQPLSASQQHHLERDYATTLQMRRTVVPSSVISRQPTDDHASSPCVCPLHGLHHPSAVSSTGDPVTAHRAWTGACNGGDGSDMPRSPTVDGGTAAARFSTFRPRIEHIYEVPRFLDGQDDVDVTDSNSYDGVLHQRVGLYGEVADNGYPTLPLCNRRLDHGLLYIR